MVRCRDLITKIVIEIEGIEFIREFTSDEYLKREAVLEELEIKGIKHRLEHDPREETEEIYL